MITKEKFQAYVKVQESGQTNMLDLRAVSALSGGVLTRADILEIRDSYNAYKEQYSGTMKIWVLEVNHRHGFDHWYCASESVALAQLAQYCLDWWEDAFCEDHGADEAPEIPTDTEKRISQYFTKMEEESWEITEHEVIQ